MPYLTGSSWEQFFVCNYLRYKWHLIIFSPKFQYGFTFGIANLAGFLASPMCAKYSESIEPRKLYFTGVIVLGISTICFGFLKYVHNKMIFLAISYFLRLLKYGARAQIFSMSKNIEFLWTIFKGF